MRRPEKPRKSPWQERKAHKLPESKHLLVEHDLLGSALTTAEIAKLRGVSRAFVGEKKKKLEMAGKSRPKGSGMPKGPGKRGSRNAAYFSIFRNSKMAPAKMALLEQEIMKSRLGSTEKKLLVMCFVERRDYSAIKERFGIAAKKIPEAAKKIRLPEIIARIRRG